VAGRRNTRTDRCLRLLTAFLADHAGSLDPVGQASRLSIGRSGNDYAVENVISNTIRGPGKRRTTAKGMDTPAGHGTGMTETALFRNTSSI
jgi:hypothetical protein